MRAAERHPNRVAGPNGIYVEHGKPLPSWMARGADGAVRTTDHRDPRYAPKPLDAAHQKLADAMRARDPSVAAHYGLHRALAAIGHANRLTTHGSGPVPVDVTERSAERIGKSSRPHRSHVYEAMDRTMRHTENLREGFRSRSMASNYTHAVTNHNDHSSTNTTTIHGMQVHTAAQDGPRLMADIERHLARSREVAQVNSGLA
ncbi:hypothetical protein D3273_17410 [Lichenibacterium minor]|uniref:Uncharacterized protein n=2 Tax=Lichenibacterium minor TaxID=2316528 RepID=A0A4Q2U2R7_9HYPH|nr:hypothetical protein D3273_17410 [Lichenibacterium minor]